MVEIEKKQMTGDMVACMSALPRGMNISQIINRYSLSAWGNWLTLKHDKSKKHRTNS